MFLKDFKSRIQDNGKFLQWPWAGADDRSLRCLRKQRLFPTKFACAIDTLGGCQVTLQVGGALCACKDVVRADTDQSGAILFGKPGQLCNCMVIDLFRQFRKDEGQFSQSNTTIDNATLCRLLLLAKSWKLTTNIKPSLKYFFY